MKTVRNKKDKPPVVMPGVPTPDCFDDTLHHQAVAVERNKQLFDHYIRNSPQVGGLICRCCVKDYSMLQMMSAKPFATRMAAAHHILKHLAGMPVPTRDVHAEVGQLLHTQVVKHAEKRAAEHYMALGAVAISLLIELTTAPMAQQNQTYHLMMETAIRQADGAFAILGCQFGARWESPLGEGHE
jgi:hypothetical protein